MKVTASINEVKAVEDQIANALNLMSRFGELKNLHQAISMQDDLKSDCITITWHNEGGSETATVDFELSEEVAIEYTKLCGKYVVRCIPLFLAIGSMFQDLVTEVTEFCKRTNIDLHKEAAAEARAKHEEQKKFEAWKQAQAEAAKKPVGDKNETKKTVRKTGKKLVKPVSFDKTFDKTAGVEVKEDYKV